MVGPVDMIKDTFRVYSATQWDILYSTFVRVTFPYYQKLDILFDYSK